MLIQRERESKVIFSILDIFELFASDSYTLDYVSYYFSLLVPVKIFKISSRYVVNSTETHLISHELASQNESQK